VIGFISKKIAKCSSDIRKCFHILMEAIILHTKSFTSLDSRNLKIKVDTVSKAYDTIYNDHFTDVYKNMPINFKKVLLLLAQYSKNETRCITLEAVAENAKVKYNLSYQSIKYLLIHLVDMGVVELKHTINLMAKTRFLK
jgi:Cdc6-like AAA superfamily ATPase